MSELQNYLRSLNPSSSQSYQKIFDEFSTFRSSEAEKQKPLCEVVVDFFSMCHDDGYLTSTLWTRYSVIKTCLQISERFSVKDSVPHLSKMLKNWQKAEEQKKSRVFTASEIARFVEEAPSDAEYLPMKVALLFGIHGLLRKSELISLDWKNITLIETEAVKHLHVQLFRKKQKGPRASTSFLITKESYVEICKLYMTCAPDDVRNIVVIIKR
jgi:integrase